MRFVASILFLFIVLEPSQSEKYKLILLRHDKPNGDIIEESRKFQLDKATVDAYFRTKPGKFLRSCIKDCGVTKVNQDFECIQSCKLQCKQITDGDKKTKNSASNVGDIPDETGPIENSLDENKEYQNDDNIFTETKPTDYINHQSTSMGNNIKTFREEKCEENDYLCIYLSLVDSDEAKNVKGDLLTLIAGYNNSIGRKRKKKRLMLKKRIDFREHEV